MRYAAAKALSIPLILLPSLAVAEARIIEVQYKLGHGASQLTLRIKYYSDPALFRRPVPQQGVVPGEWVGCGAISQTGEEAEMSREYLTRQRHDFQGGERVFECNVHLTPGIWRGVVALWGHWVSDSACAERSGGDPCDYCKRRGFHFEERLDVAEFPLDYSTLYFGHWVTVPR